MGNNSIIRTIIVDDEPLARVGLNHLLKNIRQVEVIAEAANGFEALELVDRLKPGLLFLDIQMPGINGFEVLQQISHIPIVIFTTAYDQYALKAFDTLAIDYLLKPIRLERLQRAVSKLGSLDRMTTSLGPILSPAAHREKHPVSYLRRFVSRQGVKWHLVNEEDICLFFSEDGYSYIKTENRRFIINDTLQSLEGKLDPDKFIRVHRSAIVAFKEIQRIKSLGSGRLELLMRDGSSQDVSRSYSQKVKDICLNK
ncbi:MAG: LytR/AlgR family response regulator transcription factor [Nitrospiria bacterium]